MEDLSNKPISYTGNHPLERDYRALRARLAIAEAERDDLRERHDNLKTAYANLVQEAADRLTRMYSAEAEVARLRDAGRLVQEEVTAWRDGYRDLNEQRLALAARVAELEAETTRLRQELEVQQGRVKTLLNRNSAQAARMRARMARAEAAEAEAQGWRPVTITEPSQNVMAELLIVGYRGDDGYWHYPDGPDGLVIRGWRPIPTVPQETE